MDKQLVTSLEHSRSKLKSAKAHLYSVKNEKKEIEKKIQDYLKSNNLERVTNDKISVRITNKKIRDPLTKDEKLKRYADILKQHGISDSDSVIKSLKDSQRGNPSQITSINVKEL